MNEIEKDLIGEIRTLHLEIVNQFKMTLPKAMRIGELLTQEKERLQHGEFAKWINDNLPFSDRTARNYMRLYREKDRLLKTETVSGLKDAYNLLIEHQDKGFIDMLEDLEQAACFLVKLKQGVCLVAEVETTLTNNSEAFQDIEELWKIHGLAVQIENHALEMKLSAARELGRLSILSEEGRKSR